MATRNLAYGSRVAMTVTNLQSLANDSTDPFSSWQSDRVDNRSTLAIDYIIRVSLPTANTSPANDAAGYVYLVPWTHDGSSTWNPGGNFGTTTLPTGSEGTASISEPNSMRLAAVMPYKIAQQLLHAEFSVLAVLGFVPHGWSVAVRNCSGAALSTGCVVDYVPVTETIA